MELLEFCDITDKETYRKWILKNHPDKGGDSKRFSLVMEAYKKYIEKAEPIIPNILPRQNPYNENSDFFYRELREKYPTKLNNDKCQHVFLNPKYKPEIYNIFIRKYEQCRYNRISGHLHCKQHSEKFDTKTIPQPELKPLRPNQCEKLIKQEYYGIVGFPREYERCERDKGSNGKYCRWHMK